MTDCVSAIFVKSFVWKSQLWSWAFLFFFSILIFSGLVDRVMEMPERLCI